MSRLLEVNNLQVEFATYGGVVKAVRGVSFHVDKGETLAIVGESGCGKSVTVQALMGLTPMPPGKITGGDATLEGRKLLGLPVAELNKIRGSEMSMIFQDPMSSLNPTMKIGQQIAESIIVHKGVSHKQALNEAVELLEKAQIPQASRRAKQYPFEFSGGMQQRAMIALALACKPKILFADEPTTALDVTIQAQILELMRDLQKQENMAVVLITHDLGVVAQMANRVAVMYAGQIVEYGSVDDIFYRSSHPYTLGLKKSMPSPNKDERLMAIPGSPPDLFHPPTGCGFFARCPYAMKICEHNQPQVMGVSASHNSRCWLHDKKAPRVGAGFHQMSLEGGA